MHINLSLFLALLLGEYLLTFVSGTRVLSGIPRNRDDSINNDEFPSTRATGGKDASPGQFPHQLYFTYKKGTIYERCSATLVEVYGIQIAITATHCLWQGYPYRLSMKEAQYIEIVAGDYDRGSIDGREQFRNVTKVVAYPDYDPSYYTHDIALLFLSSDFKTNTFVDPVTLPGHDWSVPRKVRISGWGSDAAWKKPKSVMQWMELPTYEYDNCIHFNKYPWVEITDNQFCVGQLGADKPKGPCRGDNGGSGVAYDGSTLYMAGVISFRITPMCGTPYAPAVFTYVAKYVDWIRIEVSKYREENNL